jgi:hypothetical protein
LSSFFPPMHCFFALDTGVEGQPSCTVPAASILV